MGCTLKDSFSKIRHISKEICRILHLCPQMQCLSGKLTSHRWTKEKAPFTQGRLLSIRNSMFLTNWNLFIYLYDFCILNLKVCFFIRIRYSVFQTQYNVHYSAMRYQ